MMKKINIKLSICFVFTLLVLASIKSVNVYASEKKDVSINVTKNYNATESEFNSNITQSIITSTYDYNVGGFKGTLQCSNFNVISKVPQQQYPVIVYQYTVNVSYSGTVSNGLTKRITYSGEITFQAQENQLNSILDYILNFGIYGYDDGTFSGILYSDSVTVRSKTIYDQSTNPTVYTYVVDVNYSGSVSN